MACPGITRGLKLGCGRLPAPLVAHAQQKGSFLLSMGVQKGVALLGGKQAIQYQFRWCPQTWFVASPSVSGMWKLPPVGFRQCLRGNLNGLNCTYTVSNNHYSMIIPLPVCMYVLMLYKNEVIEYRDKRKSLFQHISDAGLFLVQRLATPRGVPAGKDKNRDGRAVSQLGLF